MHILKVILCSAEEKDTQVMLNKIRKNGLLKGKSTILSEERPATIELDMTWAKVIIVIMVLSLVIFIAVSNACGEITLSHQDADHDHHITEDVRKDNVY